MKSAFAPTLHIQLLGEFRLEYDGILVTTINTARLQSLLAYLALHRDVPQSRQHLAFVFWPDSAEAQARTNLRKQMHFLRRALPDSDRSLYADAKVVRWLPDAPFHLDVAEFDKALTRAKSVEDPVATRPILERAVALYNGDLLPSCQSTKYT